MGQNTKQKIKELLKEKDMSQTTLSIQSGVPKSTISTILSDDVKGASLSALMGIAQALGVTVDYLVNDNITDKNYGKGSEIDPTYNEGELIKKYRFIDQPARDVVNVVLNFEYERAKSTPSSAISVTAMNEATVELPVLASTAAGVPVELLGDLLSGEVERVAVPASVGADFCLRVSGDSMEPDIPNGSIIALKSQNDAYNGDYAVFYMNNELTCKIYCKEDTHIELRSVNEAYAPLTIESETEVRIVGRVMPVQDRWYVKQ